MTERIVGWDQCPEFAHHISDDGKERVAICDLGCHAAPGDGTVWHHDPDLEIAWRYADEWCSDDD